MKRIIRAAIWTYRKSPLYPRCSAPLSRLLAQVQRATGQTLKQWSCPHFRMNLDLEQSIDAKIYYTGAHEREVTDAICRYLRRGDIAVDIGANIGFMSLHMAAMVGSTGRVIAVEASDWAFDRLQANIYLNGWQERVTALRVAAGREEGEIEGMFPCGYRVDRQDTATRQRMPLRTIDGIVRDYALPRVDLIKCDTDGFEPEVFRGAMGVLSRFHPTLIFELVSHLSFSDGSSLAAMFSELQSVGYAFAGIDGVPVDDPVALSKSLLLIESTDLIAYYKTPGNGGNEPHDRTAAAG